jgi:ribonuclease HII
MHLNQDQVRGLQRIAVAPTNLVIGVDEVGLGAVAGPLVVCAAVFKKEWKHEKVKDSKAYSSHNARSKVVKEIIFPNCRYYNLDIVPHTDIDAIGMEHAVRDAIRRASIACIAKCPGAVLAVDGDHFPLIPWCSDIVAIPKGDALVPAISAASVIAKTTRDALMITESSIYPGYGFDKHKGYLTEKHLEAIHNLGPCRIHRQSYQPIKGMILSGSYPNGH